MFILAIPILFSFAVASIFIDPMIEDTVIVPFLKLHVQNNVFIPLVMVAFATVWQSRSWFVKTKEANEGKKKFTLFKKKDAIPLVVSTSVSVIIYINVLDGFDASDLQVNLLLDGLSGLVLLATLLFALREVIRKEQKFLSVFFVSIAYGVYTTITAHQEGFGQGSEFALFDTLGFILNVLMFFPGGFALYFVFHTINLVFDRLLLGLSFAVFASQVLNDQGINYFAFFKNILDLFFEFVPKWAEILYFILLLLSALFRDSIRTILQDVSNTVLVRLGKRS